MLQRSCPNLIIFVEIDNLSVSRLGTGLQVAGAGKNTKLPGRGCLPFGLNMATPIIRKPTFNII